MALPKAQLATDGPWCSRQDKSHCWIVGVAERRAAERSMAVISQDARDALEAYAAGVNAFVAAPAL